MSISYEDALIVLDAIEFYSNPKNYTIHDMGYGQMVSIVELDDGQTMRKAAKILIEHIKITLGE